MKKNIKKFIIDSLIVIVVTIAVFFILNKYCFSLIQIKGSSMNDTLRENDKGLSFYYDLNHIERFDIVVVNTEYDKSLIKRVIGLPGEEVEYKNNKLYINGSYVKEEFLNDDIVTNDLYILLDENEYYCLGDNRSISNDSRYYGPFDKKDILSSHIFRLYPLDKIGFIN